MSQVTFSIRMNKETKDSFEKMCDSFGMSMSAAINIFATKVVKEGKIPFEINSKSKEQILEDGLKAFYEIRRLAEEGKFEDLSMDEIDKEIEECRKR